MHPTLKTVTEAVIARSAATRTSYLERCFSAKGSGRARGKLSCGNLAHGFAACESGDKASLAEFTLPNLAIVSSYNEMLSAHQPFIDFPTLIKEAAKESQAVAQFSGGVPAMCDGVTQGRPGMELSLFSRDVIAMSTAVALSHDMFDAAVLLGVCDKIVPGLLIGALQFGHLPMLFLPAGPMPSGLPNKEKQRVRELYADGKATRAELLTAEASSYHSPGTCTFYGTANSNQVLVEMMGLHLPGASFVNPNTDLRSALTKAATKQVLRHTAEHQDYRPLGRVVDEKAIINALVGLLATGGSTNHTIHLVAIARAAGIILTWDDFNTLSTCIPLLCRIYPNGEADINHFQAAGGMATLIRYLLDAELLHEDVLTMGQNHGMLQYTTEPQLRDNELSWLEGSPVSLDDTVLRPPTIPFSSTGGLKLLKGNLGRAIIKVSAVKAENQVIEAPAIVFDEQDDLLDAFKAGELERDFIAVLRFQGPRALGMPELHKLTPTLGVLQDRGFKVALVTDGRMSGASGKVPAAIHLSPECAAGGKLALIRNGDIIRLDAREGKLDVMLSADKFENRLPVATVRQPHSHDFGMGRELFSGMRQLVSSAETGAMSFGWPEEISSGQQ
jgi:phosphogluconate dehydratase